MDTQRKVAKNLNLKGVVKLGCDRLQPLNTIHQALHRPLIRVRQNEIKVKHASCLVRTFVQSPYLSSYVSRTVTTNNVLSESRNTERLPILIPGYWAISTETLTPGKAGRPKVKFRGIVAAFFYWPHTLYFVARPATSRY